MCNQNFINDNFLLTIRTLKFEYISENRTYSGEVFPQIILYVRYIHLFRYFDFIDDDEIFYDLTSEI